MLLGRGSCESLDVCIRWQLGFASYPRARGPLSCTSHERHSLPCSECQKCILDFCTEVAPCKLDHHTAKLRAMMTKFDHKMDARGFSRNLYIYFSHIYHP